MSVQLGEILRDIYVPDHVVQAIVQRVESDKGNAEIERRERLSGIQQRLAALRSRMDKMYEDKLDGKIDEQFWSRKISEWREQERALQGAADSLSTPLPENRALTAQRILELANKAHFLYLTRNHAERGQLLKMVLLNCATDGVNVRPSYLNPADLGAAGVRQRPCLSVCHFTFDVLTLTSLLVKSVSECRDRLELSESPVIMLVRRTSPECTFPMGFFECCSSGISAAQGSVDLGTALPDSPDFTGLR